MNNNRKVIIVIGVIAVVLVGIVGSGMTNNLFTPHGIVKIGELEFNIPSNFTLSSSSSSSSSSGSAHYTIDGTGTISIIIYEQTAKEYVTTQKRILFGTPKNLTNMGNEKDNTTQIFENGAKLPHVDANGTSYYDDGDGEYVDRNGTPYNPKEAPKYKNSINAYSVKGYSGYIITNSLGFNSYVFEYNNRAIVIEYSVKGDIDNFKSILSEIII